MCEFCAGKMSLEGTQLVLDTRKGLVRVGRVWILKLILGSLSLKLLS